ncbi:ABC transporter ATP-binding protein [Chamaesiphon sp. VAR_48_metabat_135_sub]|uniref:ABC transporter ATP-binding protein n=1 Tax=Chamaesiphon sp. VAR_48_metabat_135_sub TaxID=2964699 RepID=UPI00286C1E19|nr:ABC transporter ATP-binding protein [Chamaesiphon sp. VAR_48_metabat_135_sub]
MTDSPSEAADASRTERLLQRDPVLDVRNLRVEFPLVKQPVVEEISFTLQAGQTLGIVGESGSGKSMTSLAVMGLLPNPGRVTQGEVWFRGNESESIDLLTLLPSQLSAYRGQQMAMIFQEPMSSLNPVFTIGYQLVEAILQHQSVSKAEARRKAVYLLQEVKLLPSDDELREQYLNSIRTENLEQPQLTDRELNHAINQQKLSWLERYPHQLSGGQLQRVTIAMAISCNPTLLIADEPTTALDVTVQATILELLQELRDNREMAMIFITHDLGIIAEIADVVAVMYKGKIVESKPILELFQHPSHPYTRSLLACRPRLDRELKILPTIKDFMEERILPDGRIQIIEKQQPTGSIDGDFSADNHRSKLPNISDRSKPLLSVNKLKVGFPAQGIFGKDRQQYTWAVNDIDFNVYPGETLGLVGESGCGKSTLARTMLGLIEPQTGSIEFQGKDITKLRGEEMQILRRELQIIFQNPFSALNPRMNISDLIVEPLVIHQTIKSKVHRQERTEYLLQRVGLSTDYLKSYPHQLSGGQRQRVCIARALALNPKFIICDESVSALDVSVQAQVLNLFKELQGEFNLTYIFISHDLSVVKFMSDRIMVMNQGKIEEIDNTHAIYTAPKTDYTRKLISSIPLGTIDRIIHQQSTRLVV